jgi:hypothetical protein
VRLRVSSIITWHVITLIELIALIFHLFTVMIQS